MRVLVTGGAGFIGQAVCRWLVIQDMQPVMFDRSQVFDGYWTADVRNPEAVDRAVKSCHAVIHLAGILGTHELFDSPQLAIDINVSGTLNILRACVNHDARYVGITMPDVFPSVYTATKVAAGRLATAYHHSYGLPVSHVRAFNAYGPGQKVGKGHPQKIVPAFSTAAWANKALPVWGDGKQTVDLIYVDQLARILVDALAFGQDEVFDGGTGRALTVLEVADVVQRTVEAARGFVPPIQFLPMRRGEKPTNIVATGEGWDRLGWQPQHWDTWLVDTILWYRDRPIEAVI